MSIVQKPLYQVVFKSALFLIILSNVKVVKGKELYCIFQTVVVGDFSDNIWQQ